MAAEGSEPRFMNKEEESSEEEEEEELTPEEQGAQTFMVMDKRTVPTNKILYTSLSGSPFLQRSYLYMENNLCRYPYDRSRSDALH